MGHILVTGANGFIGTHLVERLVELKEKESWTEEILCLVRHTGDLSSLRGLDVKLVIGDLREPESLVPAVKGASYIYHLGAELYTVSRERYLETNTVGTENLLKAAVRHARRSLKRFLLVSSQAAAGPTPGKEPVTETQEPGPPVSWYAESKQKAEKIARQYAGDLPITIVRPCVVYGPRDSATALLFSMVRKRFHPRTGFKERFTGMVYVSDLARGIIDAARHPKTVGETYFLANPQNYSVREMVKGIARGIGKPWGLSVVIPIFVFYVMAVISELCYLFTGKKPIPVRDKVRDMSQVYWLCSPQKAKADFDWEARTSLEDGARATYRFITSREKDLKRMPGESKGILMFKYFFVSVGIGFLLELLAFFGKVYTFVHWWIAVAVVLVFWGVIFGWIAMLMRRFSLVIQFIPGFVILFAGEMVNHSVLKAWTFPGESLYGITNPIERAVALGMGGVVIPIINAIMKRLYLRKQRLG